MGDAYHLAFEDDTFDAVYSNAVLEHVARPVAVLKEALRVTKPGGFVGVRSPDFGGIVFAPAEAMVEEHLELYNRYRQHRGGDPFIGRNLRGLLRKAGFGKIASSASCNTHDATVLEGRLEGIINEFVLRMREEAIQLGWADASYFERAEKAFRAWGSSPDAFVATVFCEAIGWKT
jgi:SAM-dependent methyltransferase